MKRRPAILPTAFTLSCFSLAALADSAVDYDQSCLSLVREVQAYQDETGLERVVDGNPIRVIMRGFTSELEGDTYIRIFDPLERAFMDNCTKSQKAREDEAITVRVALADAMALYKLDRSQTNWGLIEIPALDLHEHTMSDVEEAIQSLSHEQFRNRMNDPFLVAAIKYFEKYRIVTSDDFEAAKRVIIALSHDVGDRENPVATVLDRLAKEEGLMLK